MVWSIIIRAILGLVMLAGLIMTPVGLPGNWLILLCAAVYGLATGWTTFGWLFIAGLAMAALLGEIIEFLSSAIGTQKFGGSKGGQVAAFVGTIIGLLVGSGILPIIGSLIGAFVGAFLGAFFYEYLRLQDVRQSLRAGTGAFLGRTVAIVIKELIGIVMAGMVVYHFFA